MFGPGPAASWPLPVGPRRRRRLHRLPTLRVNQHIVEHLLDITGNWTIQLLILAGIGFATARRKPVVKTQAA